MIALTRLNGQPFIVNVDLVRTVEERPDTTLTLTTGEHILVKESMNEVIERAIEYGRRLRTLLPPE
jgi:flagellar protein FlbD